MSQLAPGAQDSWIALAEHREAQSKGRAWQQNKGPAVLAVERGLKVVLGTVGGIEAAMVLTLTFLKWRAP